MKYLPMVLIVLTLSELQAQSATGTMTGVITSDSSGAPIANATIALNHASFVTRTDKKGAYRLTNIPVGVYQLRISAPGYRTILYDNLTVPENIRLVFSVKLQDDGGDPRIASTLRLSPLPAIPPNSEDRMLFYQPDSTIDFKLRMVNPEKSRDLSTKKKK